MFSPENQHTSIHYTDRLGDIRNIYVYTYIHVIVIHDKRGNDFEKEKRRVYRRVWREERQGVNDVTLL